MVSVPRTFLDLSLDYDDDDAQTGSYENASLKVSKTRPSDGKDHSSIDSSSHQTPTRNTVKSSRYGKVKVINDRRTQFHSTVPTEFHTSPQVEIRVPIVDASQPLCDEHQRRPPRRLSERALVSSQTQKIDQTRSPPNFSYPRNITRKDVQQTFLPRSKSSAQFKPLPPTPKSILTPSDLSDETAQQASHTGNIADPAPHHRSTPLMISNPRRTIKSKKCHDNDVQKYISTSLASILDRSLKLEAHLAIPRTRWSTSTLGDGAEDVREGDLDNVSLKAAVIEPGGYDSGLPVLLGGGVSDDCSTRTAGPERASFGTGEDWGDASASSPGNLSGRASTLIESDVSSVSSVEMHEPDTTSPSLPRRPSKKLSLFPPAETLVIPETETGYKLHCEICSDSFPPTEFDNWYNHTLTHFAPHPPPQSARCIFCDSFPTIEATLILQPKHYWRERLVHLAGHFETGKTLAEASEDVGTMGYMSARGLPVERPRRRRSHIEWEDESIERMERARLRETQRDREKRHVVVVHDARTEERRRRKRSENNDWSKCRSDTLPMVAKAKEIRIRKRSEVDKPKYMAFGRDLVLVAPTPKPLPVVRPVDARRAARWDIL